MGIIALTKGFVKLPKKKKKKLATYCAYTHTHTHTHMLLKINTINPMWCKSYFDHSQFHMYCSVACLMIDMLVWHIIQLCSY